MNRMLPYQLVLLLSLLASMSQAREAEPYFTATQLPNLSRWYTSPPEKSSTDFSYDVMQYIWGKTQRNDPAVAQQAIWDASYGMYVVTRRFSTAFGATISEENTPALYELLTDCFFTVKNVCTRPKSRFQRIRPYVMFHEGTLVPGHEATYENDGSYPSTHSAMGWLMALLLSEVNPKSQNRLLSIGYEFGQNRVISGFHWQSDVDAGRMAAASLFAKLHTDERFMAQLRQAKQEFQQRTGYTYDQSSNGKVYVSAEYMPDLLAFLPAPPDSMSVAFMRDVNHYFSGKYLRDNGQPVSIGENATSVKGMLDLFDPCTEIILSQENTPEIVALLEKTIATALQVAEKAHTAIARKTPYEQFGEDVAVAGFFERHSYPSDEALAAWCAALTLLEIIPEEQNDWLQCGYDYGQAAVMAGWRWQSDADAARLAATAVFARLHDSDEYIQQLAKARRQYVDRRYSVPHRPVIDSELGGKIDDSLDGNAQSSSTRGRYSINGLPAGNDTQGIVIEDNKKVMGRGINRK